MFCENCGKELRTGAKFCRFCGSPVPEVVTDTIFEGWIISNDIFEVEPVEIKMPRNMLSAMMRGEILFVCLTPPAMIAGSKYVQAAMCEDGTIHFEICMDDNGGYKIISKDGLDLQTVVNYMTSYMALGELPVL